MSEFRKPQGYKSLNSSACFDKETSVEEELFLGNGSIFFDLLESLKSLLI